MAKERISLLAAALVIFVAWGGCGQESTGVHSSSGSGGGAAGSDIASAGTIAGYSAGAGATGQGGQSSSSMADGWGGGSGRSSGTASAGGGVDTVGSAGGQAGGSSTSRGLSSLASLPADAGIGTGDASASNPRLDAGGWMPKDSAAPSGDAAVIPPLPVRQDAGASFWAAAYASNCTPPAIGGRAQADGHHKPGTNCMTSGCHLNPKRAEHHAGTDCRGSGCHNNGSPDGSGAPAFLFGGTAYRAATLVPEVAAQIGVKAGSGSYTACSASNGNFWVVAPSGTSSLTWTGASTRLRNANGEAPMMTAPAAGCNATACHTGTLKITAP